MNITPEHKKLYMALCREIDKHSRNYYVYFNPVISDIAFDKLYKKLEAIERKYPEIIQPFSPTQCIGKELPLNMGFAKVKHETPMLSLSNTYNGKDIIQFHNRVVKDMGDTSLDEAKLVYSVEPKFDGISIELIYKHGFLVKAITRGDGIIGDDITRNVRTIRDIPQALPSVKKIPYPKKLTVRGEIYMSYDNFEELNKQRYKNNEKLFMNPRNAAGGALHLKNPKEVAARKLECYIYQFVGNIKKTQIQILRWLGRLGFKTYTDVKVLDLDKTSFAKVIRYWEVKREKFNFPIDGLVIKVNYIPYRKILGTGNKDPKWATAYKFPAEQITTTLLDVTFQIGRTGVITPVAELDPVLLAGSKVSRASLHNFEYIKEKNLKIGDTVVIEKAGEIIPQVVKYVARGYKSTDIEEPTHCPDCKSKLYKKRTSSGTLGKAIRCSNPLCDGKREQALIHFVGRDMMNIDAIGEKLIKQLIDADLLHTPSDFYLIKRSQLLDLARMGEKKADKILASIQNSMTPDFDKLIFALGIPHVGKSTAKLIADHFSCFEFMMVLDQHVYDRNVHKEMLLEIEGLGEVVVDSLIDALYNKKFSEELSALWAVGIKAKKAETLADTLQGITFCITGTLSKSRNEVKRDIEENGGKVVTGVSKNLNYLVCGANAGSKQGKAENLEVPVLSEKALYNLIKERAS